MSKARLFSMAIFLERSMLDLISSSILAVGLVGLVLGFLVGRFVGAPACTLTMS